MDYLELLFRPDEDCFMGDLSFDGQVNVGDIIIAIEVIFDAIIADGILMCSGDMDVNNLININDIVLMIEKILN